MLLLMTELLGAARDVQDITCEMCQDDLASYIDIERQAGPSETIKQYPHVWWHLWTCADCAETYHLTATLLDTREIRPPHHRRAAQPQMQPASPRIGRLHVSRPFLNRVLNAPLLLGTPLGDDDNVVLVEEEGNGYQISVNVRKQVDRDWMAVITVAPPTAGMVYLALGLDVFRAPLSAAGEAVISAIPSALFTDPDGPDMTIDLVPEASHDSI